MSVFCYCIQRLIYLQRYVANIHVELGTQASGADCRSQYTQRAWSHQVVAGRPDELKIIHFEAISCRHLNFKNVLQNAPEHAIFIKKN